MTQTLFIKPNRDLRGSPKLDLARVNLNVKCGVETNIYLDTNVLVRIEKAVKEGNTWVSIKRNGLHKLVRFLQRSKGAVAVSPGLALTEMPPKSAGFSVYCFNEMFSLHLKNFIDDPTGTRPEFTSDTYEYGISDLSRDAQYAHSLPYVSLLYLNLTYHDRSIRDPVDKYTQYLNYIKTHVGIISAKEAEIARYCFAPSSSKTPSLNSLCSDTRNNFLKKNIKIREKKKEKVAHSVKHMQEISFNGACDLLQINVANVCDTIGIDGVKCDSWIATHDRKLAKFCEVFHSFTVDGYAGKGVALAGHPEHINHKYWSQSKKIFYDISHARQSEGLPVQSLSEKALYDHMLYSIRHAHAFIQENSDFE